jgi:hypothetical protein
MTGGLKQAFFSVNHFDDAVFDKAAHAMILTKL